MGLDGLGADSKIAGDLLGGPSVDNLLEHIALTRRKQSEASDDFRSLGALRAVADIPFDGLAHPIEQMLVVEWFFEEIKRPGTHGTDGDGNIAMPRNDDHRQAYALGRQLLLEVETVATKKPYVQDETARMLRIVSRTKLRPAGVGDYAKPRGPDELLKRAADGHIIIYHVHGRFGVHRLVLSVSSGSLKWNTEPLPGSEDSQRRPP